VVGLSAGRMGVAVGSTEVVGTASLMLMLLMAMLLLLIMLLIATLLLIIIALLLLMMGSLGMIGAEDGAVLSTTLTLLMLMLLLGEAFPQLVEFVPSREEVSRGHAYNVKLHSRISGPQIQVPLFVEKKREYGTWTE